MKNKRNKLHIILNFARPVFSLYNRLQEEYLGIVAGYFCKFLHKLIIATHTTPSPLPRAFLLIHIHLNSSVCVAFFLYIVSVSILWGRKGISFENITTLKSCL